MFACVAICMRAHAGFRSHLRALHACMTTEIGGPEAGLVDPGQVPAVEDGAQGSGSTAEPLLSFDTHVTRLLASVPPPQLHSTRNYAGREGGVLGLWVPWVG